MTRKLKARTIRLPRSVSRMFPNVTKAVDAGAPVEISVNRKDCKTAKKFDPTECALARAAKRELHAEGVIIGMGSSYIIKGDTAVRFDTPQSVKREIVSFDRHGDFAPGDYYLTPKPPSNRFGVQRENRKNRKGGNHKAKRKIHQSARVRILPKGYSGNA